MLFLKDSREQRVTSCLPCPQMLPCRSLIIAFCSSFRIKKIFHLLFLGFSQSHIAAPGVVPFWFTCFPGSSRYVQREGKWPFSYQNSRPCWSEDSQPHSVVTKALKPSPCPWFRLCNFIWNVPFRLPVLHLSFHLSVVLNSILVYLLILILW